MNPMHPFKSSSWFTYLSRSTARLVGRPPAFALAVAVILAWCIPGPIFHYSDTWQLVINTGTTVVTFLMVFLIQSTQNRDSEAVQVKLDELLRATAGAHNALLDLEELEQSELDQIRENYTRLAALSRQKLRSGGVDTDSPDVNENGAGP
jgi:low affinity Fe/Cu permease